MATFPQGFKYLTKLSSSRILVFGGTSGIGFGIVENCLEHGAAVIISGSQQAKVDRKVQQLRSTYPSIPASAIKGYPCDLSKPDDLENNIKTLLDLATENGQEKLNHVAFTAGDKFAIKPFTDATLEYMQQVSLVRFYAPAILAKLLPDYIVSSADSSITLTSGTNGMKPGAGWSLLAGVGVSVEGLMRGLSVDMAPVRVNVVSPGAIKTELFEGMPESMEEGFKAGTLVGKLGRPEDTSEAYVYAMKDGFVTGVVISTDGGRMLK